MPLPDKTELTEDVLDTDRGGFGFRVCWNYSPFWADVHVFRVVALGADAATGDYTVKHFEKLDSSNGAWVDDVTDAETYMKGFIKWDGCSEFECAAHWCDVEDFYKHAMLLKYLWEKSRELLKTNGMGGKWPS